MSDMEKREEFINGLLDRLHMQEGSMRDTCWFLMHSAYQEGYIDGLYDGYEDAFSEMDKIAVHEFPTYSCPECEDDHEQA